MEWIGRYDIFKYFKEHQGATREDVNQHISQFLDTSNVGKQLLDQISFQLRGDRSSIPEYLEKVYQVAKAQPDASKEAILTAYSPLSYS